MKTQTFERVSAMPAPTWHFLGANDADLTFPEGLTLRNNVHLSGDVVKGDSNAFESALATAQVVWEKTHPAPTPEELAKREEYRAAEADATYGGTAQSTYQAQADAIEEARSLKAAFVHGIGENVADYVYEAAGERLVVKADQGQSVSAEVVVSGAAQAFDAAAIDVVAAAGSSVNLSIVVDGENTGAGDAEAGVTATSLRVFADDNAQVAITRVQTLDEGFIDVDDMGLFAADSAQITVSQTVLGASQSFTGLAGDLRGEAAHVAVDTYYLGYGNQERDFNYSLRHHGRKTISTMQANGVLAGKSKKTLRGTIDLIRGCKGADGSENESVLLVDEGVRNKTVPVILCSEDDVAGNHGATIGHIRDEQLFYLASRGLSLEAAEAMFAGALVEQAALDATTDAARAAVVRLGESLTPGFAELFDEEA